jgi:hypothetical protein
MCCIDGQENKYSVLNECSRMLKYNVRETSIYFHIHFNSIRMLLCQISQGHELDYEECRLLVCSAVCFL